MQVYRGLPILTNQSEARLVGYLGLDEEGSVAEYQRLAHAAMDEILAAGRTPVVVGGTGLYLRAALADLELPPPPAPGARERLEELYDELGAERAHELLAERDPAAAAAVHPNDRRRVVRALELAEAGSSLRPASDRLWGGETRHPTLIVGLEVPPRGARAADRGAHAVDVRARRGGRGSPCARRPDLGDRPHRPRPDATSPSFRESEAVESIVIRTRRYAAYQRKWMRRIPGLVLVEASRPPAEVAQEIVERLGSVAG